jgi:hypothetical protein
VGAAAAAADAAALDPEDGFEFASLYQRLWSDCGARGAVRTAATAGLLAIRAAAIQERAREREEREERKRQKQGGDRPEASK